MKHESGTIERTTTKNLFIGHVAMAAGQGTGRCRMHFAVRTIILVALAMMALLMDQECQRCCCCCHGVFGFSVVHVVHIGGSQVTRGRAFTGNCRFNNDALEPHKVEVDGLVEMDHHHSQKSSSSVDEKDNSTSTATAVDWIGVLEDVWSHVGEPETIESNLLGIKSLGVDYGLVRTGLAVTVGYEPTPLAILSDYNTTNRHDITSRTRLCEAIVATAQAHAVSRIILGLPYHKNGTVALQTLRTVELGRDLQYAVLRHLGPSVPVWLFDERYTSKDAARRLHARDARQALYGNLDAAAAAILLENYYADGSVGARRIVALNATMRTACLVEYNERLRVQQEQVELERAARLARLERRRLGQEQVSNNINDTNRSSGLELGSQRKKKKRR
jgi:putative holliday junction resolvase